MMAATTMFAASCTDFDDYNEAYTSGSAESRQTVWENISNNAELSDFAQLLVKGGYDKVLQGSNFVTVWAPKNGTYDFDSLLNRVDSTMLTDRFIKNHIANYNYNVSSPEDFRVYTQSEKSFVISGNTFGGVPMVEMNIPSVNGTLHLLDGCADYNYNIYEYIFESPGAKMAEYFKHFEYDYFDADRSVLGPIDEFGRQTYSDSVIVTRNRLSERHLLDADLTDEDSLYTFIIPTDKAYEDAYSKIKSYFNYPSKGKIDYYQLSEGADGPGSSLSASVQSEILSDSLTGLNLVSNLVYSHNNTYNAWLPEINRPDDVWQSDTICTVKNIKLSNGKEFFDYTEDGKAMSNGYVYMADSLPVRSWDSWCPEININIFDRKTRPISTGCNVRTVNHQYNRFDPEIGDYITRHLYLDPISDNSQPEIYFNIDGVKSATYNIYVVLLPENYNKTDNPVEEKVTQLTAEVSYYTEKQSLGKKEFGPVLTDSAKLGKIDTLCLGEMTFPYSYVGTSAVPYLKLKVKRSKYNSKEKNYAYWLRIGAVILRPVEYDEYLKNED